ncbi:S8 family serine peptidase [Tunturiibacter gelidoferens]|uniref:S8 family serine peptidase n=1 Tax=Tunturiibacter gelidiferens TaxID=3069689 RepID=UPI0038733792
MNQVERTYNAWDGTTNVSAGATDHGTGVLGLAGAESNTVGIAGVAFNAKLWQFNTTPAPGRSFKATHWRAQSIGQRYRIRVAGEW